MSQWPRWNPGITWTAYNHQNSLIKCLMVPCLIHQCLMICTKKAILVCGASADDQEKKGKKQIIFILSFVHSYSLMIFACCLKTLLTVTKIHLLVYFELVEVKLMGSETIFGLSPVVFYMLRICMRQFLILVLFIWFIL